MKRLIKATILSCLFSHHTFSTPTNLNFPNAYTKTAQKKCLNFSDLHTIFSKDKDSLYLSIPISLKNSKEKEDARNLVAKNTRIKTLFLNLENLGDGAKIFFSIEGLAENKTVENLIIENYLYEHNKIKDNIFYNSKIQTITFISSHPIMSTHVTALKDLNSFLSSLNTTNLNSIMFYHMKKQNYLPLVDAKKIEENEVTNLINHMIRLKIPTLGIYYNRYSNPPSITQLALHKIKLIDTEGLEPPSIN